MPFMSIVVVLLCWSKCQGLYILGSLFTLLVLFAIIWESRRVEGRLFSKAITWSIAFVAALLASCSNSESISPEQKSSDSISPQCGRITVDSLAGMLRIHPGTELAVLGSDELSAKLNERPMMSVAFDYDFSIGRSEVTCAEFNALMSKATKLSLECSSLIPATNVTYYDAVLFANERSKAEGFDTAYTYSRAVFDGERHCTNLEGFVFHPEKMAYRLPTEAEWVLVAKSHWNAEKGWTADNSDYQLHEVCGFSKEENEPCDMMGNALEWVNDWMGSFRGMRLSNYVGAPDGGTLGQRVVKGGSYRNASQSIMLYARGDVYAVTSSTRAEYVGFRLAFGSVSNATWMDNEGNESESRVIPLASVATIRSKTGSYNAKLVFRNDAMDKLAYVDYSGGVLSVKEICQTDGGYHPDVSPNGKWVAYCTGLEGVPGESKLYVQKIDEICSDSGNFSGIQKLGVASAAIPRWRVLESGDTVIVYVTNAGNNKEESFFKSTSTWQVPFSNGKFGNPQKLFDGAYHGGISDDGTLAVTGARLLRARIATSGSTLVSDARDTVWYQDDGIAEQACNASLARDGSKRTLFLDFGGKTGRQYAGTNYSTHERLLVADSIGRLVKSLPAPAGYTFDHSEWASNGNFAVATLTNSKGAHTKIVLVDLSDSSVVDLAEGDELWHPCLWVESVVPNKISSLNLDSAGMYTIAEGTDRSKILRYRMELMWKYRDSAELVVLGSSRSSNGIDVSQLSVLGVNLSYFPSNFHDIVQFYERYVEGAFDSLKYVVISLDIDFWNFPEESSFFTKEYESFPGYVYDRNHQYWKNEESDAIYWATQNAPGVEAYKMVFLNRVSSVFAPTIGWGEAEINDSTWMAQARSGYEDSYAAFVKFLKASQANNQVVVGIIFPQSPEYRKTGSMGRYGLRRSEAEEVIDSLQKLQDVYDHFILMDENKMGFHDYVDSMAQDCDHLNQLGAKQLTARLDSVLKMLNR